jgi:hypothetical protein
MESINDFLKFVSSIDDSQFAGMAFVVDGESIPFNVKAD